MSRRGRGFVTQRINLGASKGIVINHLGRRRRSPSDGFNTFQIPAQRELDNQIRRADLRALPDSVRRAAVRVALDTGNTNGIDEQLIMDTDGWEDIPDDFGVQAAEVLVDPSHEGGEYFHFIDMAQDSFYRKRRQYYRPSTQERVSLRRQAWQAQMPVIFEAYLQYKYNLIKPVIPEDASFSQISVLGTEAIPLSTLELYPLRNQFSDALDTYLDILRRLDEAIKVRLGRDSPNWRILNNCPPCQYKLAGEATLNPSVMGALDGNNSLKRFARADRCSDPLVFQSDYFLPAEYVDQYKDEIEREMEGDPTDGHTGEATCADRWRAATADQRKGIHKAFAESGVFVAVCRHGMLWTILDMMRSGELAKYPLATISRLLEILPERLGLGYDIACSFWSTLMRSSLGGQARKQGLRMVVPAFHGHAHNRYSLEILRDFPVRIETLMSGRQVLEAQFAMWLADERKYLESKKAEPESDVLGVEYVELLTKYHEARRLWETSQKLSTEALRSKDKTRLLQVAHDAWEGVLFLQQELQQVEERLDVGERWSLESPEFLHAAEYLRTQTYRRAIDKLEGLVVQRLFELTKANISHTGYKLRMHISKALKARSKAIQCALHTYNHAATQLDPPPPGPNSHGHRLLSIQPSQNLNCCAWEHERTSGTSNCEATICHLKISHAREEITRLYVEVKRLATWPVDEAKQLNEAVQDCGHNGPLLAVAISAFAEERKRININLQVGMHKIYALIGYEGESGVG
ncbi:hypothetical protein K439DRAFT_1617574 [Ramaria rubella]|nr:hypothetical protein K439DRAFT_1617574 [Ramaria rubella]